MFRPQPNIVTSTAGDPALVTLLSQHIHSEAPWQCIFHLQVWPRCHVPCPPNENRIDTYSTAGLAGPSVRCRVRCPPHQNGIEYTYSIPPTLLPSVAAPRDTTAWQSPRRSLGRPGAGERLGEKVATCSLSPGLLAPTAAAHLSATAGKLGSLVDTFFLPRGFGASSTGASNETVLADSCSCSTCCPRSTVPLLPRTPPPRISTASFSPSCPLPLAVAKHTECEPTQCNPTSSGRPLAHSKSAPAQATTRTCAYKAGVPLESGVLLTARGTPPNSPPHTA